MKVPVLLPKIFDYPFTYESGTIKSLKPGDLTTLNAFELTDVLNLLLRLKYNIKTS